MSHSHIFDARHRNKLSSEERLRLLMPNDTLKRLGYTEGSTFADIGCGTGVFTFPAAEIGGASARLYAVDTSQEMLDDVTTQAAEKNIRTITTVKSDPYDFKLDSQTIDFVIISSVLHEIDDKSRFLAEAKRICKPGGKIAVIEFTETDNGFGPPLDMRIKPESATKLLSETGFVEIERVDISAAYYAVTGIA